MTKVTDPETGMALLPEGDYWQVTKDAIKYDGHHIYRLRYIQAYQKQVKRLKWYGKVYTKTLTKHRERFVVPIWNKDFGGPYESGYAPVITATHLRNASFRALEEYDEALAKAKRLAELEDNSNEFLGDYPPKSLN